MNTATEFTGFPVEGQQFLLELEQNNNRTWFGAHKDTYERVILEPALDFVVALGTKLQTLDPAIRFDLRTNGQGTLMRIHRDVRFSEDKSPYKTAVAGVFNDGTNKKMAGPGYGFHLEPGVLRLMAGTFSFSGSQLSTYRAAVADETLGTELENALAAVQQAGRYQIMGEQYKRVPQGFPPDHPRADLLRFGGFYASPVEGIANAWGNPAVVDEAYAHFRAMTPLYAWLKRALS